MTLAEQHAGSFGVGLTSGASLLVGESLLLSSEIAQGPGLLSFARLRLLVVRLGETVAKDTKDDGGRVRPAGFHLGHEGLAADPAIGRSLGIGQDGAAVVVVAHRRLLRRGSGGDRHVNRLRRAPHQDQSKNRVPHVAQGPASAPGGQSCAPVQGGY